MLMVMVMLMLPLLLLLVFPFWLCFIYQKNIQPNGWTDGQTGQKRQTGDGNAEEGTQYWQTILQLFTAGSREGLSPWQRGPTSLTSGNGSGPTLDAYCL